MIYQSNLRSRDMGVMGEKERIVRGDAEDPTLNPQLGTYFVQRIRSNMICVLLYHMCMVHSRDVNLPLLPPWESVDGIRKGVTRR